ncbi:hypothetical protein DFH09DRAFT_113051 [Mycena vulgaris]|nr:hypothetical protein DFH09DRAFT_113051 [Mycena vulgaris]
MSSSQGGATGSPLYRYAVLAAVFLFASVFATVYFRSRLESRRRQLEHAGPMRARILDFDPLMKPPLFDAYLAEAPPIPRPHPHNSTTAYEWDEIMPLSAYPPNSMSPAPDLKGDSDATSPPLDSDPSRVLLSVIVRMPVPSLVPPNSTAGDELPLPYLELGLSEVDVLHGGDRGPTKT